MPICSRPIDQKRHMKYKIAVCDDLAADRELVCDLIGRWAARSGCAVQTELFSSAESFLFHYSEQSDFDILLLDIEMEGIDGVSLAKKVRAADDRVQIVFVSGYSDYIAEGYDVEALHYLLKPIDEKKLFAVLDRAVEKLGLDDRTVLLSNSDETVRLPMREIIYVDVVGNYSIFHAKFDFSVKMTLSKVETLLDDRFIRVGRSLIINLEKVRRVTKTDVYMTDGSALQLPKGASDNINRAIIAKIK